MAVALAAAAVLVSATPAAAHDELMASSPSPGQDLSSGPEEISLTFSADVLTVGAAVIVADGSARDWTAGEPSVEAGTVTVPLEGALPAGGYEIRWRVVSADGHPISGLVPFTVGGAAPLERAAPADDGTPPAASPADSTQQSASDDQGIIRILLVGLGGAAVAVAAYALIRILRRKKNTTS
ncbi:MULTISPECIES: copper resistance CopC family protein [unclassified Microbacterium]|uniref:copper resistance CopC family protein n=1 Tax=unclassified Microbacterium TaxID=2609290 RepID=UPI00301729D5